MLRYLHNFYKKKGIKNKNFFRFQSRLKPIPCAYASPAPAPAPARGGEGWGGENLTPPLDALPRQAQGVRHKTDLFVIKIILL